MWRGPSPARPAADRSRLAPTARATGPARSCAAGRTRRRRAPGTAASGPTADCTPAGRASTPAASDRSWPTPPSPANSPVGAGLWPSSRSNRTSPGPFPPAPMVFSPRVGVDIVRPRCAAGAACRHLRRDENLTPGQERAGGTMDVRITQLVTGSATSNPRSHCEQPPPVRGPATLDLQTRGPLEPKAPSCGHQPAHIRLTTRRSPTRSPPATRSGNRGGVHDDGRGHRLTMPT